ncbi:RidA family protein [Corynebacterium pseudodiphtheriticum]|uniref:RidA family protein n=1 Tax=Corynebacterium pseudodiphtheriticum TaxID=37637 RepID=A0ABT7FUQ8_9CORY|nr:MULTISPECIES: RidA family protein [Corynebacterium]MCT1635557.1 RidA family protein [Corynebacterium pseudodiphtheriticum]MCT1666551.1 RidA family protein [Corynebacterium pseudodiphtheriticum]MDC7067931.1 RidA family protein [Corynebacterium pseudodiphtheriticum]MDC7084001.1 RidA family protein [Corynebacterium pseudodiphtheriticum]MDC7086448.1 RidA family protein [Corynebacterium pseudodiphtheriticum]
MNINERLAELGIELPNVAKPLAAYVPAKRVGKQVWTSGQLPLVDGQLPVTGLVGDEVSADEAYGLARICALNALAAVDAEVGLDNVASISKLVGFVASAPGFYEQPAVVNGASDLVGEIFGDAGQHVRSAVGVAVLPKNAPVEVEMVVELR